MAVHSGLPGLFDVSREGVGSHCDDGHSAGVGPGQRPDLLGGLIAVHDRHLHVHEDQAIVARRGLGELFAALDAVISALHNGAGLGEELNPDLLVERIVFYQQEPSAAKVVLGLLFFISDGAVFCIDQPLEGMAEGGFEQGL